MTLRAIHDFKPFARLVCWWKGHDPYPLAMALAWHNPWYLARCARCHKFDESFPVIYDA